MIMSSWDIECPICGHCIWGDEEYNDEEVECPDCGSLLSVSTVIEWDTLVEVKEERHNDSEEEEAEDENE